MPLVSTEKRVAWCIVRQHQALGPLRLALCSENGRSRPTAPKVPKLKEKRRTRLSLQGSHSPEGPLSAPPLALQRPFKVKDRGRHFEEGTHEKGVFHVPAPQMRGCEAQTSCFGTRGFALSLAPSMPWQSLQVWGGQLGRLATLWGTSLG